MTGTTVRQQLSKQDTENEIALFVFSPCSFRLASFKALCAQSNSCTLVGVEKEHLDLPERFHKEDIDLIVLDMDLFGRDTSVDPEPIIQHLHSVARVCVLAGCLDVQGACRSIASGADGYLLTSTSLQHALEAFQSISQGKLWLEEDVMRVIADHVVDAPVNVPEKVNRLLSQREHQILQAVAEGETNKGIAKHLFLSESSVRTYWYRILSKLNALNKAEAITKAFKLGLLEPSDEDEEDAIRTVSPRLRTLLNKRLQGAVTQVI